LIGEFEKNGHRSEVQISVT